MSDYSPDLEETQVEVLSIIDTEVAQSVKWNHTEIQQQIAHGYDLYFGEKPAPCKDGFSKYVSRDVFDAIESMIVPMMETITANPRIVQLTAASVDVDSRLLGIATQELNKSIMLDNSGYRMMHDFVKDGLLAKNGITKTYWKEEYTSEVHEFESISDAELAVLLNEEDVDIETLEVERFEVAVNGIDLPTATNTGTVRRIKDVSHTVTENVPPEEFIIAERTRDIRNPSFAAQRKKYTLSELKEIFPDKTDIIDEMAGMDEAEWNSVLLSRHSHDATYFPYNDMDSADKEQRMTWIYECYVQTTLFDGEDKLWRVITDRYHILDQEEVDCTPFSCWTPFVTPHKFYGESVADVMEDVQLVNTELMRGILDHNRLSMHPRYSAKEGSYDVRALLDNRPGVIVEMKDVDNVMPIPQSSLPQAVFQTLQKMDQVKAERSGQSKASKGLDENLLKTNHSGVMVNSVIEQGEMRLRGTLRNLVYLGLVPMFKLHYKIWRENDKKVYEHPELGEWTPSELPPACDLKVSAAIGRNAQVEESNFKLQMYNVQKEQGLLTLKAERQYMMEILILNNVMDVEKFVPSEEELKKSQFDMQVQALLAQKQADSQLTPVEEMEMQLKQQEQANRAAELEIQKTQAKESILSLQLDKARLEHDSEMGRLEHEKDMIELHMKNREQQAAMALDLKESERKDAELKLEAGKVVNEQSLEREKYLTEQMQQAEEARVSYEEEISKVDPMALL